MGNPERVSRTTLKALGHDGMQAPGAHTSFPSEGSRRPIPPPPPPSQRSASHARAVERVAAPPRAALASVRLDAAGTVLASEGAADVLAQLAAYVGRIADLVGRELSLDPFSALHAELLGRRVVVFEDAGELVGLLLEPGQRAQLLRQQLGV